MEITQYSSPVNKLLTYGEPPSFWPWPNYLEHGFTKDHIPELITMLTDESLHRAESTSDEVWGPLHAWRILGRLQAVEAIPALLDQLFRIDEYSDDWANEDMPKVFALIGAPAISGLSQYLADSKHPVYARICAAESLKQIGERYPETYQECISVLEEQLKEYFSNDFLLNGFLVSYLSDLDAIEALSTIQQAFKDDCVDLTVAGDCEDIEIYLGVRDKRSTPHPNLWRFSDDDDEEEDDYDEDEVLPFALPPVSEKLTPRVVKEKIGRNDPCPCGSGKKFKKCCMNKKDAGLKEFESDDIP